MTSGRIGPAPCGHFGVHVVGDYVHCFTCDPLPNRDQLDPTRHILCPSLSCRTLDVTKLDEKWWKCNQCGIKFEPTRGNQP